MCEKNGEKFVYAEKFDSSDGTALLKPMRVCVCGEGCVRVCRMAADRVIERNEHLNLMRFSTAHMKIV